ncbi:UNVERIFIED_CONTAM: hypothetical protein Sradi_1331900 [Sesamum radiatum]|uniref:Uncharacterized protein n=1 Tax=Sesamum radiatum TaxID=300843 RepID=A0AAW2UPC8_SESRA
MDTPRIIVSPDVPPRELSSNFLETIQQMIISAIREQLVVLVPPRVITSFEVAALELADPALPIPRSNIAEGPST